MAPWFDTEDDFDHDLLNKLSGISFPNYSETKALNFAVDYIGQKGWDVELLGKIHPPNKPRKSSTQILLREQNLYLEVARN
jgi:hypothetical protein